jgi:hypothetical protein
MAWSGTKPGNRSASQTARSNPQMQPSSRRGAGLRVGGTLRWSGSGSVKLCWRRLHGACSQRAARSRRRTRSPRRRVSSPRQSRGTGDLARGGHETGATDGRRDPTVACVV